jgi:hypothetical protein
MARSFSLRVSHVYPTSVARVRLIFRTALRYTYLDPKAGNVSLRLSFKKMPQKTHPLLPR